MPRILQSPSLLLAAVTLLATGTACSSAAAPVADTDAVSDVPGDGDAINDSAPPGDADGGDDTDGGDDADLAEPDTVEVPEYPADPPDTVGGDRPARVIRPAGYDPSRSWPVVLLLHGYGASGQTQDLFLGVSALADELGFILVLPDGTRDEGGSRFWNASDACCNFGDVQVDDVAYLTGLLEELGETHHVDPRSVYAMGHSNGGFMSYGLACRASETFVAIASIAGAAFLEPDACTPASRPVSVLQIHGTDDDTVLYGGGSIGRAGAYPSAAQSVAQHASLLGCDAATADGDDRDLEGNIAGAESMVARHSGCPDGLAAELWTIDGGGHIPLLNPNGTRQILEWLLSLHRD